MRNLEDFLSIFITSEFDVINSVEENQDRIVSNLQLLNEQRFLTSRGSYHFIS